MKRAFDLVVSALGLALLWPLFLVIAVWIRLDSRGPVFFRQERVGRAGRLFRIHKFRTMHPDAEGRGRPLTVEGDSSITAAGRFLRRFKLDELPQLMDVTRGHMSLVGPRPEVPKYVALYAEEVRSLVLSVRPGITDLASIRFRDENRILAETSDPEHEYVTTILPIKLAYAKAYVQEHSFWGDLRILMETGRSLYGGVASGRREADSPQLRQKVEPLSRLAMGPGQPEESISESERIRRVYREYDESPVVQERWSPKNPGNQRIATECFEWMQKALRAAGFLPLGDCRVLEVGCGHAENLPRLLELGGRSENIYGVDILPERIESCRRRYPSAHFSCQNAEQLDYPDAFFRVVLLMTVFSSILDDSVASSVAREVRRVLAPGGAVVWWDMRYPNPWNRHVRAVSKSQIRRYFSGFEIQLASTTLLPGLARRLGRYTDKGYSMLAALPFLRSHWVGLFTKNNA